MRILGIVPALPKPHYFSKMRIPSIGLLTLLTKLRQGAHRVKMLMEEVSPIRMGDLKKEVKIAELIAISSLSATQPRAEELVRTVRKECKKPIVVGGPHVSFCPEDGLRFADFVIRNEGEFSFLKLVEVLENDGKLSDVPNLSWKKDGKIIHNPLSLRLPDLNIDSPFPDFSIISGWNQSCLISLETSRGCPFSCNFCCVPQMFKKPRFREPESVIEEIKRLNPRSLFFCDDNFAISPERSKEILVLMLKKLNRIPRWAAQARVNIGKDKEWLRLAKRTGCCFLCIGFESNNPDSLKEMNKKQTLEEIEECLANFKEIGMLKIIHGSFIVGFDSDNKNSAREIADWARRVGLGSIQISILTPFFGTQLHSKLEAQGRILSENPGDYDGAKAVFVPAKMSPEELQKSVFSGLKRFSSPLRIVSLFLRGLVNGFKEYLFNLIDIRPLRKHFREAGMKLYIRTIVEKIEKKSRKFLLRLKNARKRIL